jgi:hypothetical protein
MLPTKKVLPAFARIRFENKRQEPIKWDNYKVEFSLSSLGAICFFLMISLQCRLRCAEMRAARTNHAAMAVSKFLLFLVSLLD